MKFDLSKEFLKELSEYISNGQMAEAKAMVQDLHYADVAEIIDELNFDTALSLFKILDGEPAADVLVELEEDVREKILANLSAKEIAEDVIENLDSDDAADLIGELSEEKKEEVLAQIEDLEQAKQIVDLLNYAEDSAGGLMAKELIQVNHKWSVMRCVKEMRRQAEDIEEVHAVYVVDDDIRLLGTLSLKKLLTTSTRTIVEDIFDSKVRSVKATTEAEEVAIIMKKYDMVVIPVVDDLDRLLGRITFDDILDVMKDESDKDYQMASGISENVEASDSVLNLTRARLPWLIIGMFGGVLGAQVIGIFDIEKNMEMAFFIPLITAMGGNVGVQSSALVVQSLSNNSIGFDSLFQKMLKELMVALANGLVCSLLIFGAGIALGYNPLLSLTVAIALLSVVLFASLFGTFVPLALNKYKIDPALATGPFITTANDVLGLFIYFYIGKMIFGY
jgi:magnesium transporter